MLDPIADMLTRIRNAQRAGHNEVLVPASKFKKAIAEVLRQRGFIDGMEEIEGKSFKTLKLFLKYRKEDGQKKSVPMIKKIKRVSKEGQRIYAGSSEIGKVKGGYGLLIVSTSKGVMSGEDARKNKVGGELICEVW